MHTLHSPLFVLLPRKTKKDKKWYLNQNNYRNDNFRILAQAKTLYTEFMTNQVEKLPEFNKVSVTLHIYARDKRLFDIDNIAAVHTKFVLDSLVKAGKLPDDNYLHVPETHTYFAEIDRTNPRVEIVIEELPC